MLIATDVLAEGQNLQDAHIVVNFDLPWAIIRLIQRAGRVDRIGQQHDAITVYWFLPLLAWTGFFAYAHACSRRLQQARKLLGTDESGSGRGGA